jgi:imidazoleglycerol phosphate synthase glutamine amidotransferase subunit HisH
MELLGPMGESGSHYEGLEPFLSIFLGLQVFRYHSEGHCKSCELIDMHLLELLGGLADFPSVNGTGVEENQVSCFAFDELTLSDIRIAASQFHPV